MTKQAKKSICAILVVTALIAVAVICRVVTRLCEIPVIEDKILNVVRTLIYLGLFSAWGFSVYRRVMQIQARKFLCLSAILMVLWIMLRAFKFYFITSETAIRYFWYAYYLPMLFIPTLALFVALSIGKHEGYRLPKTTLLLLVPAVLLLALVLTNDLHQCVFRFPDDAAIWTEEAYKYGWGYFLTVFWGVSCGIAALSVMFFKSKLPKKRWVLWIPVVSFLLTGVSVVLYALRIPFARAIGWDLAIFESMAFTVFFESCIQSGLIQSNTRYADMFRASRDLSVQITDNDYVVQYSAENAEPISREILEKAEASPIVLNDGKLIHNMPISGGRAVWTEDISELLSLQSELKETQEELKDRKSILEQNYKIEEEHKIVEEQNRLYDLLQSKTQRQINGIEKLAEDYRNTQSEEEKRRILARIVVLGSFIKRRKDFVLLTDYTPSLPESKLTNAFAESYRALELYGIKGTYSVKTGKEYVSGDILTLAYDFFEEALETALEKARYIVANVSEIKGKLRITITLDCEIQTESLLKAYPQRIVDTEDGETELCLPLTGGAR